MRKRVDGCVKEMTVDSTQTNLGPQELPRGELARKRLWVIIRQEGVLPKIQESKRI